MTNTDKQSSNYDVIELKAKYCISYQYKFEFSSISCKSLSLQSTALGNATTKTLKVSRRKKLTCLLGIHLIY